ncbi:cupin domain-containing protein [Algoriphagus chordae]|uniref:Cupin domain-containing protein n=1 Tax=Algoriphagus chordae TaxID=237019 RepID=A0A2W7QE68_9BACT|nr:cupin domain-containing protein [Algoriphagus chordae]PZX46493.1 Cupin domain-containing protein [Algoriphagus chordae]
MKYKNSETDKILLKSGEGRIYNCGTMTAVFKADETETACKYSISEWWLQPNSEGPGIHSHDDNDEIFYGIEGITSILVGEEWVDVEKGTFLRIPAKTTHDFANRTNKRCGILNFFIPGGFERNMPSIVKWFEENKNPKTV